MPNPCSHLPERVTDGLHLVRYCDLYTPHRGRFPPYTRSMLCGRECTLIARPEMWPSQRCVRCSESTTSEADESTNTISAPSVSGGARRTRSKYTAEGDSRDGCTTAETALYPGGCDSLKPSYTPRSTGMYPPFSRIVIRGSTHVLTSRHSGILSLCRCPPCFRDA